MLQKDPTVNDVLLVPCFPLKFIISGGKMVGTALTGNSCDTVSSDASHITTGRVASLPLLFILISVVIQIGL